MHASTMQPTAAACHKGILCFGFSPVPDRCLGIVLLFWPTGHTRGMSVPAKFFASPLLLDMVVSEAQASSSGSGGFVASLQQLSNARSRLRAATAL